MVKPDTNERPPTPREVLRDSRPVQTQMRRCPDCDASIVALVGDHTVCACDYDFGDAVDAE